MATVEITCIVPDCEGHDTVPQHVLHALQHIANRQETIMATIADLTGKVTAITDAVTRLDADFRALKEQLSTGGTVLSAADQTALDAADASLTALADTVNTDDPAPTPTPA